MTSQSISFLPRFSLRGVPIFDNANGTYAIAMFFPTEGDGQPLVTSPVIVFMVWKNLEIYESFQAAHTPVDFLSCFSKLNFVKDFTTKNTKKIRSASDDHHFSSNFKYTFFLPLKWSSLFGINRLIRTQNFQKKAKSVLKCQCLLTKFCF